MAYYGYRARTTYAPGHRTSAPRTSGGIYLTQAGEGVKKLTCDGASQGFTQTIEVRQRTDGSPLYYVQSEQFPTRYYALYQQANGSWFFSGNSGLARDAKVADRYIGKVQAFIAGQQLAVVA